MLYDIDRIVENLDVYQVSSFYESETGQEFTGNFRIRKTLGTNLIYVDLDNLTIRFYLDGKSFIEEREVYLPIKYINYLFDKNILFDVFYMLNRLGFNIFSISINVFTFNKYSISLFLGIGLPPLAMLDIPIGVKEKIFNISYEYNPYGTSIVSLNYYVKLTTNYLTYIAEDTRQVYYFKGLIIYDINFIDLYITDPIKRSQKQISFTWKRIRLTDRITENHITFYKTKDTLSISFESDENLFKVASDYFELLRDAHVMYNLDFLDKMQKADLI